MVKKVKIATIFIITIMITIGNLSVTAQPPHGDGEEQTKTISFNGYCDVGASWEKEVNLGEVSLTNIVFELTWEDDEGSDSEPDSFSLATDDGEHELKSDQGASGKISVSWEEDMLNNTWNVVSTCESAGPTNVPVGPIGLVTQEEADPGNSWNLDVTYTYTESMGGGGPPPNVAAVLESPVFKVHIALMVASVFLFLITGLVAGAFIFTRITSKSPKGFTSFMERLFNPPLLLFLLVIVTFIVFFLASVPIGMWVAGMFYGWNKAWTGFPAIWNPEAFDMTNADNVSFIVLLLWFIPMYINRAQIMRSKYFKKLFGWSKFAMKRAEMAPNPKLSIGVLALCYCLMGIFTFVVFEVQPHGSG
ncbi:MAG: hypothetical protein JSV56_12050 [Methanomassiliicoccales archaeon]|nr:MAG: hypothetical protein JSV56_12050 [Methanomassiliicoccales archaeon]